MVHNSHSMLVVHNSHKDIITKPLLCGAACASSFPTHGDTAQRCLCTQSIRHVFALDHDLANFGVVGQP
jgi:hypothetical protein